MTDFHNHKSKKRTLPSFLKKTYEMLQSPANNHIVKWGPQGKGFLVANQELFTQLILPKYFKHSNYSSFVRQLNMYNFHKLRESGTESHFYHELFRAQNNGDSIHYIKRKPERKKHRPENENVPTKKQYQRKSLSVPRVFAPLVNLGHGSQTRDKDTISKEPSATLAPNSQKVLRIDEDSDNVSIVDGIEDRGEIQRPFLITKQLILESHNMLNFHVDRRSLFSIGSLLLK